MPRRKLHPDALFKVEDFNVHRYRENCARSSMGLPPLDHDVTDYSRIGNRRTEKAAEKPQPKKPVDSRLTYELKGSLYTEHLPIRLEESILADNDDEANKIARRKAREYRNLEGYAVALFTYNNSGKQIGYIYVKARSDNKNGKSSKHP